MRVPGVDMQPLPGWGPPPCSLTPAADVLRLALSLLLLTAPPCALGMPSCKEEEFRTGAMCCPKCRPGYRVQEACGEFTGTVCEPCTRGTYTPHLNGLPECLPCGICDPGLGQVTRRKCFSWTNTVCGCRPGLFCERQDGDSCVQCRPHSVCRPGQRVRETGTKWQDTLCEECEPGTFSAGGTQAACMPWAKCSGPFTREATPGTSSSDVTCSPSGPVIILISVIILIIAVISVLVLMSITDRRSRDELAFPGELLSVPTLEGTGKWTERNRRRDLQASRVQPDVTPEPAEETASLFPQSDHHLTHGCGMQTPEPSPRGCGQRPGPQGPPTGSGEPPDPLLEVSLHLAEEDPTCCARSLGPPASPNRAPEVPDLLAPDPTCEALAQGAPAPHPLPRALSSAAGQASASSWAGTGTVVMSAHHITWRQFPTGNFICFKFFINQ